MRRAAAQRVEQEGQRLAARRLGLELGQQAVPVAPAQAMLDALFAAHADFRLYQLLVADLAEDELVAETMHLTGEKTGEAKRHALVQLYEDAQHRVTKIAGECLKAKVAEEQVKAAQDRAAAFAEAMRALALALGHSPADPKVRSAMRSSLQLVAGQAAAPEPA